MVIIWWRNTANVLAVELQVDPNKIESFRIDHVPKMRRMFVDSVASSDITESS